MNGSDLDTTSGYRPDASAAPPPLELPDVEAARRSGALETSPAWELELLISAAIVVGLFALPGIIEHFFARIEPHATAAAQVPLAMLHLYLLSAGYALLVAFTIHFSARAYWVGLIGLNSVFPRGLRWDRLSVGPVVTEVYRKRLPEARRVIERVDNFCSITFSFAFMIVIVLVFTIVLMGVSGAIAWSIAHLFFHGRHEPALVEIVVFSYVGFAVATIRFDKQFGHRLATGSASRRWLGRVATLMYFITPTAITGPILLTLTSNIGRRRMILTFQFAVLAMIVLAASDRLIQANRLRVNSYTYFASRSDRTVDVQHYADQRPVGARNAGAATVQSELVTGPYVELFVPYVPSVDNAAVAARCPAVAPLARNGVIFGAPAYTRDDAAAAALRCLATLHPVTLDGSAVSADYDFYQDPATGLQGMLAHIPTASLAAGRHLLTVARVAVANDSATAANSTQFIPFWR